MSRNVGIIITAAGFARRFREAGGNGNKLDARLNNCSVFAQTLNNACATHLAVHVVTRPENTHIQDLCHAQQVPVTLIDSTGLGESIAAGVRANSDWHGWLIHLADMPFVPPDVFLQVADALKNYPLVRPRVGSLPGHPVGFDNTGFDKLCGLTGDNGARELLKGEAVHFIEIDDGDSQRDIDLPSQLVQGRK